MLTMYTRIARPEEEHGVSTPTEYVRLLQVQRIRLARRRLATPEPHVVRDATPIIRQGRWLIECGCGNFPVYDPEWELAVCLNCAAIHRCTAPPRWREVETTLMRRPDPVTRNMEVGETLADLRRENEEHGLGEVA